MKIRVKVIPHSVREEVIRISENKLVVRLLERAEKGNANARLRKILAKEFNVGAKDVIIKNLMSREKVVELINL